MAAQKKSQSHSTMTRWNSEQNYFEQLESRIRALEAQLGQDQEAWLPEAWRVVGGTNQPAFVNGWINFGAGYNSAGFRKEKGGVVRLRGLVKAGTPALAMFTLPVGYRPLTNILFGVHGSGSEGRIDVTTAGVVLHVAGGNSYIQLDGVTFVAGQ